MPVKHQPLGTNQLCRGASLVHPCQAGQESCPGFVQYCVTSSPSITTNCLLPLVFGPLTPKIPSAVSFVPEPSPFAFLQQRGGWYSLVAAGLGGPHAAGRVARGEWLWGGCTAHCSLGQPGLSEDHWPGHKKASDPLGPA